MHIGIIASSVDILILFTILWKYDFSYTFFFDQEWADWSEKNNDYVIERTEKLLKEAKKKGVDKVILTPLLELYFLEKDLYSDYILPLYTMYIQEKCLPFSRIGKIGIVGDYFDLQNQGLIKNLVSQYVLTDIQNNTKKFHAWFAYWFKQVRMRKLFVMELGWKNWMMHNVVKHDLRSLLDAGVDTIIPCNYWYLAYDATIKKYIRTKKTYWHGIDTIEAVIATMFENELWKTHKDKYAITIVYTWHIDNLIWNKKLLWLLQKGKQHPLQSENIIL